MQPVQTAQHGPLADRLVDGVSRRQIDRQRTAAPDKDFQPVRFGKVMFQVIALLADAQEQFLGPRTGPLLLGARYLLCEDQLGPAHRIIGIEIAFVVEHEARNRINQQYARKEKGEVAVNGPAPFPHGGHKRPCPHDVQNFLFQNFITPAVHMVERKVFLAFFGFAVGDTGTEVGDTLFGAAGNRFAAGLMFSAASGFALAVLPGDLVLEPQLPLGKVSLVDPVFDQRARHPHDVVHAFGLEAADLLSGFNADHLRIVGSH